MTLISRVAVLGGVCLLVPLTQRANAVEPVSSTVLAGRVDKLLADAWARNKVAPAAVASDEVFARRVYLDLVGRIPTVAESRSFLADTSRNKREKLVDQLLDSGGHARHAATFWRRVWLPQADTPQFANLADVFEEWLAAQLADNVRYDVLARTLISAKPDPLGTRPRRGVRKPPGRP